MNTILLPPVILAVSVIIGREPVAYAPQPSPGTPANDRFEQVVPTILAIGDPLVLSSDNTGATVDGDFQMGSLADRAWGLASVWHAFTLTTGADVTLDYCGSDFAQPGAFADLLFPGRPDANEAVQADAIFPSPCGDGNYAMTFTGLAPGTYYIAVGCLPGVAQGPYTLTVSATSSAAMKLDLSAQ